MADALKGARTEELIHELLSRLDGAFNDGFAAGHAAGYQLAYNAMLNTLQTIPPPSVLPSWDTSPTLLDMAGHLTSSPPPPPAPPSTPTGRTKAESRAPRGLVAEAIAEVLTESPGLRVMEVVDRVVAKHPEIAHKSVGNQMRRGEGEVYERKGKYAWYLKGQAPQTSLERPLWDPSADQESV